MPSDRRLAQRRQALLAKREQLAGLRDLLRTHEQLKPDDIAYIKHLHKRTREVADQLRVMSTVEWMERT